MSVAEADIEAFLDRIPFNKKGPRRLRATPIPTSAKIAPRIKDQVSTQGAFGQILAAIAAEAPELAERIVTTSPDVSVSTNLGPWINKTGLFSKTEKPDVFQDQSVSSMQKW